MTSTTSFTQTFSYALRRNQATRATVIGGNLAPRVIASDLAASHPEQYDRIRLAAAERFAAQRGVADRQLKAECGHWILSFKPEEDLSNSMLNQLSKDFLSLMVLVAEDPDLLQDPERLKTAREKFKSERLPDYQWSAIRHYDKPHPHVHLIVGRRALSSGRVIPTDFDYWRSQKICRLLEQEYGLQYGGRDPRLENQLYRDACGEVLEQGIRDFWKETGYLHSLHLKTKNWIVKAHPATEFNPQRLSFYQRGKRTRKPALVVYRDTDLGIRNNQLDLEAALHFRDHELAHIQTAFLQTTQKPEQLQQKQPLPISLFKQPQKSSPDLER